MTTSQNFRGSGCLNLPGKSNLHSRKMNHMLSRNGFPHSCIYHLSPERVYGKYIFGDLARLKTSWIYPYTWLIIRPYFMFKMILPRNFERITSSVAMWHHSDSQCFICNLFCSLWRMLGFLIMCFDLGLSYSNSLRWVLSGPFQSGSPCSGEFSCIISLIISSPYCLPPVAHLFALCSTFQNSSSTLSSNFTTNFFVSSIYIFLNAQELFLFFKSSIVKHSVRTLWMPVSLISLRTRW